MRKSILKVVAAVMFAFLLSFNVTTSMNGDNFSLEGFTELAVGSTGDCHDTNSCSCRNVEDVGNQTCVDCSTCETSLRCDSGPMTGLCGN